MPDVRPIDANEVIRGMAEIMKSPWFNDDKYSRLAKLDSFHIVKDLCIDSAPTISAVPVVHGRWVRNDLGHAYCSKCYERLPFMHCYTEEPCSDYDEEWDEEIPETRYCPNCGAKMDAKDMDVPTKDGGAD